MTLPAVPRGSNPFVKLPSGQRENAESQFLSFFELSVATEDENEELWAVDQLRSVYVEGIAGADDLVGSFFDAMQWAAWRLSDAAPAPTG